MNRKHWTFILGIMLIAALAGCGQKPEAAPNEPSATSTAPADNSANTASQDGNAGGTQGAQGADGAASSDPAESAPSEQTETIKVYYADQDFIDLTEAAREIHYSAAQDSTDKYKAAFEALQDPGDTGLFPLWGKMQLLSVKFSGGEVTLDVHMPDEARLGSDGELMALDSLQKTFFQFDEVNSIELLVDGQKLDSLMGHADLLHPMTRDGQDS